MHHPDVKVGGAGRVLSAEEVAQDFIEFEKLPELVALFRVGRGLVFRCHKLSIRKVNRLGIYPVPVFTYKFNKLVYGLSSRDIAAHNILSSVKSNSSWSGTDISVVRICHFTRTIHNTSHNSNLDTLQVIGAFANHCGSLLQIK